MVVPQNERRCTKKKVIPRIVLPSIVKEPIDLQTLHVDASLIDVIIQHGSQLGGFPSPITPQPSLDAPLGSSQHAMAPPSSPMAPRSSQHGTTPSLSTMAPWSS